jgi:hypothetical protein
LSKQFFLLKGVYKNETYIVGKSPIYSITVIGSRLRDSWAISELE